MSVISRMRGRSWAELRFRGEQALRIRLERIGFPILESRIFSRVGANDHEFATEISDFLGVGDAAAIALAVRQSHPNVASDFLRKTEDLHLGKASLLGFGPLVIGNPPQWHREAVRGLVAPMVHWSKINYLDAARYGDHKVLWEPNRLQYLFAPAFCWLTNRDPKTLRLVEQHLRSWVDLNPPRIGANWASSLELAYRAIACCWLLSMLRSAPWPTDFVGRMVAILEVHAIQIERNLSKYFSPNTHLTGEALGLFYIAAAFPHLRDAARWRELGSSILLEVLSTQVREDGTYFEQASQYHRYTAEIYLHFMLLARAAQRPLDDHIEQRICALFDVLRSMADGRGVIPLFGDDDGGYLMPFDHRAPNDVSAILLAGACAFGRRDLVPDGPVTRTYSYWLCGVERTDMLLAEAQIDPNWNSIYCAAGGAAIIRDGWSENSHVALVDAGPHGSLNCGHAHADALAMTLTLGKTPICVDRGTLTYVGDERDEFRRSFSHNTLEIDGASSVEPRGPFHWARVPSRAKARLFEADRFIIFRGEAIGHVHTTSPSRHRRSILHMRGGCWIVHDQGERSGSRSAISRWQLDASLAVRPSGGQAYDVYDSGGQKVAVFLAFSATHFTSKRRTLSARYGHVAEGSVLEIHTDSSLGVATMILPAIACQVASLTNRSCTWTDSIGSHRLAFNGVQPKHDNYGWNIDADVCCFSHVRSGSCAAHVEAVRLVVIGARRLAGPNGIDYLGPAPDFAECYAFEACAGGDWARVPLPEPRWGEE